MNIEIINLAKEVGLNPILILIVLVVIPIFLKIENFIQSYDSIKSRKLNKIQQAIDYAEMPELEIQRLTELKINELYYQATGLNVDTKIRPLVLKLIDEFSLNEHKINRIRHYLTIHQGQIQIDITKIEWCFLFVSKWVFWLLSIVMAIIIIFSTVFIGIIRNDVNVLKAILQLFFMSLFVGLMYASEARKYTILCKIYENNRNIFQTETPNAYWKIGSIAIFFILISANFYFQV